MALRVIIPVKPFDEAKRRLSPVMVATTRAKLARKLFTHVLATVVEFADPRMVVVISRAPEVLALAEARGAKPLAETSRSDLNAALRQAAEFSFQKGATGLLVVASDLPLLQASDLAEMTDAETAIASDRHGRGTNALLWPANPAFAFHFGEDSFARHLAAAKAAGFDPRIVSRPGLAHDVDEPEDLLDLSI